MQTDGTKGHVFSHDAISVSSFKSIGGGGLDALASSCLTHTLS